MRIAPILLALVLFLSGCSGQAALNNLTTDAGYTLSNNIVFDDATGLKLDIYTPNGVTGAPVVVFFYGGRWEEGSKEQYKFVGQALAARGFVAVLADYRLYPRVRYPGFIIDCAKAVRWTHGKINNYGGDPNKIVVMGHSAGAYNAAMLALNPAYLKQAGGDRSWLRGMIGLAGPYDFLPITDPDLRDIFGPPESFEQTQPVLYADGSNPPVLLLHGENDETVKARNSHSLAERIQRAGGPVETVFYPKMTHGNIIATLATSSLAQLAVGQSDVGLYVNEFVKRVTSAPLKAQQQQAPASGFQTVVPQP